MTAFYMFRLVSLTFYGAFRGPKDREAGIHESPPTMTVPLVILAALSVVGGYVGFELVEWGNQIKPFLSPIVLPLAASAAETHHEMSQELLLMAASVAVAGAGIAIALLWYKKGSGRVPEAIAQRLPGVYRLLSNKYYVDEAYEALFVDGLAKEGGRLLWEVDATVVDLIPNGSAALTRGFSWVAAAFDQYVVDGLVNGIANTLQACYRLFRRAETGRVQNYALFMGAGLFAIVTVYLFFR